MIGVRKRQDDRRHYDEDKMDLDIARTLAPFYNQVDNGVAGSMNY